MCDLFAYFAYRSVSWIFQASQDYTQNPVQVSEIKLHTVTIVPAGHNKYDHIYTHTNLFTPCLHEYFHALVWIQLKAKNNKSKSRSWTNIVWLMLAEQNKVKFSGLSQKQLSVCMIDHKQQNKKNILITLARLGQIFTYSVKIIYVCMHLFVHAFINLLVYWLAMHFIFATNIYIFLNIYIFYNF